MRQRLRHAQLMPLAGIIVSFLPFAQSRASSQIAPPTTVTGIVFDSLSNSPLRAAQIQLMPAGDRPAAGPLAATTDSAGRFSIAVVMPGSYVIGFFHPLLDSLGLQPTPQSLTVSGTSQRVALATPSPATLRRLVCPESGVQDSTSLVLGHVRRTGTRTALEGATVTASWAEFHTVAKELGGWSRREQQVTASTTGDGWFALCGVPGEVPVLLRAAHAADSSGYVRLTLPAGGFRHLVWTVGEATRTRTDSVAGGLGPVVWRGTARLVGQVRDSAGRPLANAHAHVWGTGRERTTDARGSFTLDSLPGGTQTVEVRAIGYAPVTRVVQLVSGERTSVEVALTERVTDLPTIAVTARPERTVNIRLDNFYQRMRDAEKGINRGYFFTPEDIERRNPPLISNLFDGLPGVRVARDPFDRFANVVKGPDPRGCMMNIFFDGQRIENPFDRWVLPNHVAAVEVYPRQVTAPPRYQTALNQNCGLILIWTK